MKKYFITGLVTLLPLALTLIILIFIFNVLTAPFAGLVERFFQHYELFTKPFLIFSADQIRHVTSQFLVLVLLFGFIIMLGWVARLFFIRYLIRLGDRILHKIPILRSIYKLCQDVIKTLFGTGANSFKQVVMVPFPHKESFSIGLITGETLEFKDPKLPQKLAIVFIPTAPNPTSGFVLLFPEQDLNYLDIKIEEAFKFIISCGVIGTSINTIKQPET